MSSMGRKFRPWLYAGLACLASATLVHAQMGTSSGTDVMQVFRTMSPDQQQQILQQLGINGGGVGTGGLGTANQSEQAAEAADLEAQRFREQRREQQELEERFPILRPQDWIVVEVDTSPLPPRPVDTTEELYRALITGTLGQLTSGLTSPLAAGQLSAPASTSLSSQVSTTQLQQLQQQLAQQAGSSQTGQQGSSSQSSQSTSVQQQLQQPYSVGWQAGPPNLLTPPEPQRLAQLAALIRSNDPYQLTRNGVLNLPGFAGIPLAGLTDAQATLRLQVEPALRGLYFRVTKLPLTKMGAEGLKPFGYDIFENPPSTFAPVTNVPLPADYVLGPGDVLEVQLYGNQNRSYTLQVDRDGQVNFPELGPISVGGQRFLSVKEDLEQRVARQMIGVKASVSMGTTRAIRVFVLGEVQEPGSYAVSGLATITSALYAAGGVKPVGSLRDIQLKRQGRIVQHLDLYDLLIRGDTTDDARLLPGDVIFIPTVGPTVSIEGEVNRPAIYEIKGEADVGDLVQLAGGLTPDAEPTEAWVTRIDPRLQRVVLRVNLTSTAGRALALRNGDVLRVERLIPTLDSAVVLQGHVYNPGTMAYRPGMRLTDVIHSVDDLEPNADLHYVLIRRELPPDRRIEAFSADLTAALAAPDGAADVTLMPRDQVTVFDLESGRDRIIEPVIRELQLQSGFGRPEQVVQVEGRVKVPGQYPLEPGMRVSDLLRAGGGLSDAAYGGQAELARYTVVNGEERQTQLIPINLAAVLRGDPRANIELQPYDDLSVKQLSLWSDQEHVTLLGQVRFPGVYTIQDGETLKSVLLRAGGLTKFAFPEGSVFTRVELKEREQDQLNLLAQRTQTDLTTLALEGVAASTITGGGGGGSGVNALAVGQALLTQLKATQAVGRLVIDLPRLMRESLGSEDDVVLRNGDELMVPKFEQEVTVIGEVQSNTSHLYRSNLTRDDYIRLSGGLTRQADARKIYVVRANGSVVASSSLHFFREGSSVEIRPGDTIVVPINTERLPPLPEWQAITGIIYNLAIGAAAIREIGVL